MSLWKSLLAISFKTSIVGASQCSNKLVYKNYYNSLTKITFLGSINKDILKDVTFESERTILIKSVTQNLFGVIYFYVHCRRLTHKDKVREWDEKAHGCTQLIGSSPYIECNDKIFKKMDDTTAFRAIEIPSVSPASFIVVLNNQAPSLHWCTQ